MGKIFPYISILALVILISCSRMNSRENQNDAQEYLEKTNDLVPINYDYGNLNLHLNASINDAKSKIDWRWDYLSSNNATPDSIGMEQYMNISQPAFSYNGETTLPSLSIITNRNKIIDFSVTVLFYLPDHEQMTIESLLDSLITFNLFKNEMVRTEIVEKRKYHTLSETVEEKIILKLSQEQYEYDRITYRIKNRY